MNPFTNPFSPGAGNQLPELAGRGELLRRVEILLARTKAGRSEQSMFMVGLRGVGKTVLFNRVREMAEAQGYAAIEANGGWPGAFSQNHPPPDAATLAAEQMAQKEQLKVQKKTASASKMRASHASPTGSASLFDSDDDLDGLAAASGNSA